MINNSGIPENLNNFQSSSIYPSLSDVDSGRGGKVGAGLSTGAALGISAAIQAVMTAIGIGIDIWRTNKQNKYNEEMWNKQNEYNSPVNQMKLLRDAGINPLLQFMGGSPASTAAGAVEKNAPDFDLSSLLSLSSLIQLGPELTLKDSQAKLNYANAELASARAISEAQRPGLLANQAAYYSSRAGYTDKLSNKTAKDLEYYDREKLLHLELLNSSKEQKDALVQRYGVLNGLSESMNSYYVKKVEELDESIAYLKSRTSYTDQLTKNAENTFVLQLEDMAIKVLTMGRIQLVNDILTADASTEKTKRVLDNVHKFIESLKEGAETGKAILELFEFMKVLKIIPIA